MNRRNSHNGYPTGSHEVHLGSGRDERFGRLRGTTRGAGIIEKHDRPAIVVLAIDGHGRLVGAEASGRPAP